MKIYLDKTTLQHNLKDFLSQEQQPFHETKAYLSLCDALFAYLTCESDQRQEKKQIFQHAKEVFDDMVATIPEPKQTPSLFEGIKQEFLQ